MIELQINTTVTTTEVVETPITTAIVNGLYLNYDQTHAWLHISYQKADGSCATKRFFRVSGMTYAGLIMQEVTGNLADIVIGNTAAFAMSLITNPELIDGNEVVELSKPQFLHEFIMFVGK